jgi:protein-S-isoprenylcysteine O-methyltransferase Ste14
MVTAIVRPYFETHPIGSVWIPVAVITVVIELSGGRRRRREATKRDGGSQIVLRVCLIPAAVFMLFAPQIAPAAEIRPPLTPTVVAIVVFASGEALRVWSKLQLGRYFTYTVQTSDDQPVITSGPYRILRHPSYTGLLLMVIGIGLLWGNWLGLGVLTVLAFAAVAYRISVEEKALVADLGDRYRTYAEHHKRLIPFVW